jgi:taurine transport system substrate-binding protein
MTLVLAVLGLSGCSSKEETTSEYPEEINFGVLRVPNDEILAISANILQDNFTDLGIEVNLIPFDSGVQANKAFASNSIDFATMGNTNSIIALAKDLNVELIWIHEVLGDVEGLAVKDSSISEVSQLKGKKIATPFASTSHYVLLNVLKEAGIEEDVTLLDMKTAEIVAAWIRGDIDGAYTWQPTLGVLLKDGKMLVSSADMVEKGYITANVACVRNQFAEQYPDLVALYISSLAQAQELYKEDPAAANALIAKELDISAAETESYIQGSIWVDRSDLLNADYFGTIDNSGNFANIMKDTSDFLMEQKSVDNSKDLTEFQKFVNPEFIELSIENEK